MLTLTHLTGFGAFEGPTPGISYSPERYVRFLARTPSYDTVTAGTYLWSLHRISGYETPDTSGTDLFLGKTVIASQETPGQEALKAVDGTDTTNWSTGPATVPQWLRIDLAVPAVIRSIVIYPRNTSSSGAVVACPTSIMMQRSSDGTSFYDVTAFSITNNSTPQFITLFSA